jgi:hypothetical protein
VAAVFLFVLLEGSLMSKADKIAARRRSKLLYPTVDDVINHKTLTRHIHAGLITDTPHDRLPVRVHNYTAACERRRVWDQTTITCRGLIRDNKQRVIARPMQKFFTWGHKTTSAVRAVRFTDPFVAYEKLDGTMITASNLDGQLLLATRGSFDAWQLTDAARLWPADALPDPGTTWVLEHVGPDNQIVVPYDTARNVLLAVVDNHTGADLTDVRDSLWGDVFDAPRFITVDTPEALIAACDGVEEGWVCEWVRPGKPSGRLKVKNPAWLARWKEIHTGAADHNSSTDIDGSAAAADNRM